MISCTKRSSSPVCMYVIRKQTHLHLSSLMMQISFHRWSDYFLKKKKTQRQLCWLCMNGREAEIIYRLYWNFKCLHCIFAVGRLSAVYCTEAWEQSLNVAVFIGNNLTEPGGIRAGLACVHVVLSHTAFLISLLFASVDCAFSLISPSIPPLCLLCFLYLFFFIYLSFLFEYPLLPHFCFLSPEDRCGFLTTWCCLTGNKQRNKVALTMLALRTKGGGSVNWGTTECFLLEQIYCEPINQWLWLFVFVFLVLALLELLLCSHS